MDGVNDLTNVIKSEPLDLDALSDLPDSPDLIGGDFFETEVKLEHIDTGEVDIKPEIGSSEFECTSSVKKDGESEDSSEERETIMFINIIKERPAIWNVHCKDYLNDKKKKQCWNEVLSFMVPSSVNFTKEEKHEKISELQNKWRHLKNQFMRENIKKQELILKKSLIQRKKCEKKEDSSETPLKRKRQEDLEENKVESSDDELWDEDMFSLIFLHQFIRALPEDEKLVFRTKMLNILIESFSNNSQQTGKSTTKS